MGGEHKCSVCQATFTRPQHVARHMRSHTGDRPYKCQHCGDQFARSDLLSRHINKCHANEKPIPSTNGRRKGSAAATRATTSKQACDQCVQSSLPCDGCNPCSKCIQRKSRCTFVKFHRQTAPVGPGHSTRPNVPAVPSQDSSMYPIPSTNDYGMIPSYAPPPLPPPPSMHWDMSWPPQQHSQPEDWSNIEYEYDYDSMSNSSAASSSAHLPLVGTNGLELDAGGIPQMTFHPPGEREGFSSAFGLLSLDDPNVMAGLSNDGVPFFSQAMTSVQQQHSNSPEPPRPSTSSGYPSHSQQQQHEQQQQQQQLQPQSPQYGMPLSTPSREAETRELKEFWKAYMRTPLTNDSGGMGLTTPTPNHFDNTRRHRVNSLPSVKTPTGVIDSFIPPNNHSRPHEQFHLHAPPPTYQQRAAGVGIGVGNADDLRSYEAAVLARKTPALNLEAAVLARKKGSSRQARPGVKRGASHTLGPDETKFARRDGESPESDSGSVDSNSSWENNLGRVPYGVSY